MIAEMLMFINFPVIVNEWGELSSLASSLRNETPLDKYVSSPAKLVADGCVQFV